MFFFTTIVKLSKQSFKKRQLILHIKPLLIYVVLINRLAEGLFARLYRWRRLKNRMKVSPNQNSIQNFRSRNVIPQVNNSRKNVAFGSTKGFATRAMETVIDGSFLVNFLVVDALSMIIPRIVIGLLRDKDKTGKLNYKAGAEEAGREVISGPSMMVIPMLAMAGYKQLAPATHMEANTLKAFTNHMTGVAKTSDAKTDLHKTFADKLFEDAFAEHDLELENRKNLKEKFIELLNKSANTEKKFLGKNESFKKTMAEFEEHVSLINNQNLKEAPADAKALSLDTGLPAKDGKKIKAKVSAGQLFEDFHNYSKDVLAKFKKQTFANGENAAEYISKLQRNRAFAKISNGVVGFLAVGAFLLHLPKIYQMGKVSPAMESAKRAQKEAAKGGTNENS